jgi:hypothetical protein
VYYINREGTSFSFIENTTRKIYRDFCFVYVLDNDTRQFHVGKGLLIESFDTREEADLFISWITDCFQFNAGDSFNINADNAKGIVEFNSRISVVYNSSQSEMLLEIINNVEIAKLFINWIVIKIATSSVLCRHSNFEKDHKDEIEEIRKTFQNTKEVENG